MRVSIVMVALMLAGCAAHPPASSEDSGRHEVNVAAAQAAGYEVRRGSDGSTLYCAPAAATGSHIAPGCLNETA